MRLSLGSLQTYHRFISWSRKGILLILGGFFVALISWSSLTRLSPQEREQVDVTSEAIVENRMEKPYFSSLSDEGEPYEIWATEATNMTAEHADLINPEGKIKDKQGRLMRICASKGHYTKDKHFLALEQKVQMRNVWEGHLITTEEAFVDMKNQEIQGRKPIRGEGPAGLFWGESFEAKKNTGFLLLNGRSHLVILPSQKTGRTR